jgi:beta-phosphoglucomutase-like phosphatase (HAD superfamily)
VVGGGGAIYYGVPAGSQAGTPNQFQDQGRKIMIEVKPSTRPAAILFDLDGTLVESWTTVPMPHAKEALSSYHDAGMPMGIITNQAGPMWHLLINKSRYPSPEQIAENIFKIVLEFPYNLPWFISIGDTRLINPKPSSYAPPLATESEYAAAAEQLRATILANRPQTIHIEVSDSPTWRKPAGGALIQASKFLEVEAAKCLYVGDLPEDGDAAEAAGMRFLASYHWLRNPNQFL